MPTLRRLLILAFLILPMATAATITFDEAPASNDGSPYSATILGVTFSGTNAGIWSGMSNGDPGGWSLEGTNGNQFLGFNGDPYSETLTFLSPVNGFSADFSRSGGSSDGTITLSAFNGSTLLGSTSGTLGAINTWLTLSLSVSGIDTITWSGTGSDFHPYGVDNINFNSSSVPEPSSVMLVGLGLLGVLARGRLRRTKL